MLIYNKERNKTDVTRKERGKAAHVYLYFTQGMLVIKQVLYILTTLTYVVLTIPYR